MPSPSAQSAALPRLPWRALAFGCAVAVWLLGILAYSPQLHARMHGHAEHAGDCSHEDGAASPGHTCAVTLFQNGVESPVWAVEVRIEPLPGPALARPCTDAVPRPAADLRLHSGQAPPAR